MVATVPVPPREGRATEAPPVRVLVVDDNPVVIEGLTNLLAHHDDIDVVGTAADGAAAITEVARLAPDVVLLDVRMPGMDGVTAARQISTRSRVVMLTSAEEVEVIQGAIDAGAAGYLVHGTFDVWELATSIRAVHGGGSVLSPTVTSSVLSMLRGGDTDGAAGLTARETQLMELIVQGLRNREIAELMYVSEKTVKNHINRTYAKLGATSRADAVARWRAG